MKGYETDVTVECQKFTVELLINDTMDDYDVSSIRHECGSDLMCIATTQLGQKIEQAAYENARNEGVLRKWRA